MVAIKISRGKFSRPGPDTSALRMLERLTAVNYILHVSHVAMGAGKSCLKMKTRHTAFIFDKEQNVKNGKEN